MWGECLVEVLCDDWDPCEWHEVALCSLEIWRLHIQYFYIYTNLWGLSRRLDGGTAKNELKSMRTHLRHPKMPVINLQVSSWPKRSFKHQLDPQLLTKSTFFGSRSWAGYPKLIQFPSWFQSVERIGSTAMNQRYDRVNTHEQFLPYLKEIHRSPICFTILAMKLFSFEEFGCLFGQPFGARRLGFLPELVTWHCQPQRSTWEGAERAGKTTSIATWQSVSTVDERSQQVAKATHRAGSHLGKNLGPFLSMILVFYHIYRVYILMGCGVHLLEFRLNSSNCP